MFLASWLDHLRGRSSAADGQRPGARKRTLRPAGEGLERREVMSTASAAPAIVMKSATTTDSKSVTIDYTLSAPASAADLTFGVYRSADASFQADQDVSVATVKLPTSSLDSNGKSAGAVGEHTVTLKLDGGLPLNPLHPYVLVVADPSSAAAADPGRAASFRVYTIGIVTHGGIQNTSWKNGPPWELVMARLLQNQQGYDTAIPFNWVKQSSTPGEVVKQGPRLANRVLSVIDSLPQGSVVDLHFIGHSEGAIINEVAIKRLEAQMTASQKAGWIEMTMLDPHAANNGVDGGATQFSTEGILGSIADMTVANYQSRAKDPAPFVPAGVDEAQVFYQQSKAKSGAMYNLWGQVPVIGSASYYNITGTGATHSGDKGVYWWYIHRVLPTLGDGSASVRERALKGSVREQDVVSRGTMGRAGVMPKVRVDVNRPTVQGTTAPGSTVMLYVSPAGEPTELTRVGEATAGADGTWSITTRQLGDGRYRFIATARGPGARWGAVRPTDPMGMVVVRTSDWSPGRGGA